MEARLKMFLGAVLIESIELCYDGLETCEQRESYQSNLAKKLLDKHRGKISLSKLWPVIYVEAQSRMNYLNTDYE